MRRPLTIAILASLTAHALLLLVWATQRVTFTVTSVATAPSTVQVSFATAVAHPPAPATSMPPRTVPQPQAVLAPVTLAASVSRQPAPAPPTAPAATIPATAENRDDVLRSKVLQQMHMNFANYFYYPMLARRNGWQGMVLLGFAVEADGAITHMHIARGSGYAILDESALAALRQASSLPLTTVWLNGGRVELKLPIEYRLTGG